MKNSQLYLLIAMLLAASNSHTIPTMLMGLCWMALSIYSEYKGD